MKFRTIFKVATLPKKEVKELLYKEMSLSFDYIILLLLSIIVATMGLIMNSTAIIIGAMILSPILWPILGLALGTVEGEKKPIIRSLVTLAVSIVITLVVSFILGKLSLGVLSTPTQEILLRSKPNLLDLIVALAVGFAAPAIIIWQRFSNSAAGVAIAASLLPPLTVTGVGIALGSSDIAWGSLVLFLTNLASVLFAGIAIFFLYGYRLKKHEERATSVRVGIALTVGVLVFLAVQLFFPLYSLVEKQAVLENAKAVLATYFSAQHQNVAFDGVDLTHLQSGSGYSMNAILRSTQDIRLSLDEKKSIEQKLSDAVGSPVILDLRILPSLQVVSQDALLREQKLTLVNDVESVMLKELGILNPSLSIDSVSVDQRGDALHVYGLVRVPEKSHVTEEESKQVEMALEDALGEKVNLDLELIKTARAEQTESLSPEEQLAQDMYNDIESYIAQYFGFWDVELKQAKVTYNKADDAYDIFLELHTPTQNHTLQSSVQSLKNYLYSQYIDIAPNRLRFKISHYVYDTLQ